VGQVFPPGTDTKVGTGDMREAGKKEGAKREERGEFIWGFWAGEKENRGESRELGSL